MAQGVLKELKDQIIFRANIPTKNGRIYTDKVILSVVDDPIFKEKCINHCNYVILDLDKQYDLANIMLLCGSAENIRFENNKLIADINILDTPSGEIVNSWLNKGMKLYFTPRGHGDTKASPDSPYLEVENYTFEFLDVSFFNPYYEED